MIGFLIEVWIMLGLLLAAFFTGYWVGKHEAPPLKLPIQDNRNNLINLRIRLGNFRYKTSKRRKNTFR